MHLNPNDIHALSCNEIMQRLAAIPQQQSQSMRQFSTGANRDSDQDKHDYEGFLSPLVIEAFGRYMHKKRIMADGSKRASDNWQLGMPPASYIKSAWRHMLDWWKLHRGYTASEDIEEALCGVMFNAMGYLHEHLKTMRAQIPQASA